jgi:hypothetical protein
MIIGHFFIRVDRSQQQARRSHKADRQQSKKLYGRKLKMKRTEARGFSLLLLFALCCCALLPLPMPLLLIAPNRTSADDDGRRQLYSIAIANIGRRRRRQTSALFHRIPEN